MQTKVIRCLINIFLKRHFQGLVPSDLELMDLVTQKLDNKTIILLGMCIERSVLTLDYLFLPQVHLIWR